MAIYIGQLIIFIILALFSASSSYSRDNVVVPSQNISSPSLSRKDFPPNFLFGASGSAYQFEGAANEDGRGPSIWDTYSRDHSERILDHTTGDIAIDFYHRYKEDIKLMKYEGIDAFRFSISWSRILPYGKLSEGINQQGITFYKNLTDELIANGIIPTVTLFHWDVPQALEDEYQGFLSPLIVVVCYAVKTSILELI